MSAQALFNAVRRKIKAIHGDKSADSPGAKTGESAGELSEYSLVKKTPTPRKRKMKDADVEEDDDAKVTPVKKLAAPLAKACRPSKAKDQGYCFYH